MVPDQKETHYMVEAKNGDLVRVPASKLAAWQEAQNNPRPLSAAELRARDELVSRIYASKPPQFPSGAPSVETVPQASEDVRPASTFSQPRSPFPPGIRHMSPSHMYDMDEVESMIFDYEGKLDILAKENDRLIGRNKHLLSQLGEVKIKCKELEEDLDYCKHDLAESDKVIDKAKQVLDLQHSTIISANAVRKKAVRNAVILTALITAFASIVLTACVCLLLSGGAL